MIPGLTKEHDLIIKEQLIEPLKKMGARVYLFGSRATGKYKKFSDIDLLFEFTPYQKELSFKALQLLEPVESSSFPYKIDLVEAQQLAPSYKEGVLKSRVEL